MHVNSVGDRGRRGYWYNDAQVTDYDFAENNYGVMEAPDNIMAAIDDIHRPYGVDFPAADFFYPTFTDDLIAQSTRIDYLGTVRLEGRECFRLVARGTDHRVQLWIANDATFLPVKFIITDHTQGNAQYEGTFADWAINPDVPAQLYEFQSAGGCVPYPHPAPGHPTSAGAMTMSHPMHLNYLLGLSTAVVALVALPSNLDAQRMQHVSPSRSSGGRSATSRAQPSGGGRATQGRAAAPSTRQDASPRHDK